MSPVKVQFFSERLLLTTWLVSVTCHTSPGSGLLSWDFSACWTHSVCLLLFFIISFPCLCCCFFVYFLLQLFQACQLIQRIVDAWRSNEKEQYVFPVWLHRRSAYMMVCWCWITLLLLVCFRSEGGRRRGYMGHLTRIANSIVHNSDKGPNGPQIQGLISGKEWF